MSRAAKTTLAASVAVSALTVWGVHFMQQQERKTMHAGVERDEARQAEKRRQRALELEENRRKEAAYQEMQPTAGWLRRGSPSQARPAEADRGEAPPPTTSGGGARGAPP